jgi:uncharacterized membrane protein YidH (DUF202 family)
VAALTAPFDTGLQAERTLLAWRRTCLSLAAAGAVAIRYTVAHLGTATVATGLVVLALSATGWLTSTLRYHRAHQSLTDTPPALGLGGTTVTATAAATILLGLLALTVVSPPLH